MRATRRLAPILLAFVAAVGLIASPQVPSEVRAATPDLTIVGDARYEVQPEQQRVVVTVDLVLTNHLRDTVTTRYYFDQARLAVLPDTSGFRLTTSGTGTPSVRVHSRSKDFTVVQMNLGRRLYGGQTARYRLRFVLEDPGGSATRDVRIGASLAAFPVWAFATESTPGGSVTVIMPEGFSVEILAGEIPAPTVDDAGRTVLRTGRLAEPLSFFAYLVADRPGAYSDSIVNTIVGAVPVELTIRSWPDDPAWAERVGDLIKRALPVMGDQIGLAWPRPDGLVVRETVSRTTGGYAGLFDPSSGHIEVAYYADDFIVLHEAAHAWFNGDLLVDRWANEAFASYYALEAAATLGVSAIGHELTAELRRSAIPLNAWGPIGREADAVEDYAYAATLELARLVADRASRAGLTPVWAAAAAQEGAYQPPGEAAPELVTGPPDWRGLLDLLEDHTGMPFEDLWRTWVVRPDDEPLLDERQEARERYAEVVAEAGDWRLPRALRDSLRAWQFEQATAMLDQAVVVLGWRDEIETKAAVAGLVAPTTLKGAFEDDDGFADAAAEAAAQRETITRYEEALARRPDRPDFVEQLGLWSVDPDAVLAAARDAFASGDMVASAGAAQQAEAMWQDAAEVGRGRLIGIVTGSLAALLALALLIALWRRRRAARRQVALVAGATPPTDLESPPDS
jgi:hypothetical protein